MVTQVETSVNGLLGIKLGMTQKWDDKNQIIPITVIKVEPNVVTQLRTLEIDGYVAVQIASGNIDPRRVNKPMTGHFKQATVTPRKYITEVRLSGNVNYSLGQQLTLEQVFKSIKKVDVVAVSKGKGFAGVMKRHNFSGVSSSHGEHRNHRKPGSIGASATPSRVFKGTKMAGRLGGAKVTVHNLRVFGMDLAQNLLFICGCVPGAKGRLVFVRNTVKARG